MDSNRSTRINGHLIEEYWWAGSFVVYVDNCSTEETYEEAIKRLNAVCEVCKHYQEFADTERCDIDNTQTTASWRGDCNDFECFNI